AVVGEQLGALEGALAADRGECVDSRIGEIRLDLVDAGPELVRVQTTGTQDGSTAEQDAADVLVVVELNASVCKQALPAVLITHDRGTEFITCGTDDSPDDSIESGAVAARRESGNSHVSHIKPPTPLMLCH